jgi:hypothetical protein
LSFYALPLLKDGGCSRANQTSREKPAASGVFTDEIATLQRAPSGWLYSTFMNLNKREREIVAELLNRMNARRRAKHYKPVAINQLPELRGDPARYYLVDTFQVRRHWRRRPTRQ